MSIKDLDEKKLIKEEKQKSCMFKPNDNVKSKWDIIIIVCAIFNCLTIPLSVAFQPKFMSQLWFRILNFVIDFIFGVDIIISFRTEQIDDLGNLVTEP
jgi:hypothetical protein